jgi:RPA family protein
MNKLNLQGFTNLQDCLEKALPPVEGEIRKYKDGQYKMINGHWKKLKQEDIKKIQNEIKANWELRTKEQEQDKIILIPDSKDYERAKSAKLQSEKAIASQAKSIQDLEKVLKRGLAFEFFKNKYSKEFRNRARELGATPKLLQRYDKLVEVMGEHANYGI